MVLLVPGAKSFDPVRFLIVFTLIILIAVVILYAWRRWVEPYANGEIGKPKNVLCSDAPPRPINLLSQVQGNRVFLDWNPTAYTDSYTVLLGTTPNFQAATARRTVSVLDSSTVLLNLNPGSYYVRVVSVNTCGESQASLENAFLISTFPAKFRICKRDNQRMCLRFFGNIVPTVFDVDGIPDSQDETFEFKYEGGQIKNLEGTYCLNDNLTATTIEEPVDFQLCPADSTIWTIDFITGRIVSDNNLALGANSLSGTVAFNTNQASIFNASDSRYAWEIQARTF